MDVASKQLEKARIYAYWGFAGIVYPVIGIIASCISISILNRLSIEGDEDAIDEKERLLTVANGALALSSLMAVIYIGLAVYGFSQLYGDFSLQNQNTEQLQKILNSSLDSSF